MSEPKDLWKHRRIMAYSALIGGLLFPLIMIQVKELADVATPFYLFVGAIVGAYIGYATADAKWQK